MAVQGQFKSDKFIATKVSNGLVDKKVTKTLIIAVINAINCIDDPKTRAHELLGLAENGDTFGPDKPAPIVAETSEEACDRKLAKIDLLVKQKKISDADGIQMRKEAVMIS